MDLIDRQAALEALTTCELGEEYFVIESLPSAQKTGKWVIIHEQSHKCKCSECGAENYYAYVFNPENNTFEQQDIYCPNCGAYMKGDT